MLNVEAQGPGRRPVLGDTSHAQVGFEARAAGAPGGAWAAHGCPSPCTHLCLHTVPLCPLLPVFPTP